MRESVSSPAHTAGTRPTVTTTVRAARGRDPWPDNQ